MWLINLNLGLFLLLATVGYLIGAVVVSIIILFIADVIKVIKKKIKGEIIND